MNKDESRKIKRGVKVLKDLIRRRKQQIAFDANMAQQYGADYLQAVHAARERGELDEAGQVLDYLAEQIHHRAEKKGD